MATIKPFENTTHREQVIVLWEMVFGYDSPHNRPALAIDKKIAINDQLFFVALAGEAVIGTVMAGYDGHRGWIYSVAVDPKHRRQGIGSRLVLHAERALVERGCVKINLQIMESNRNIAAFYASLGYVEEKRVSMGKRIDQNIINPPSIHDAP
jgi:ribosomal protein S18 acetylase RimI-like enzyme